MTTSYFAGTINPKLESVTYLKRWGRGSRRMLSAFAWPGGYPLVYMTGNHDFATLCPSCATKEYDNIEAFHVYYEGPPIICDECYTEIESAYGDPDTE